MDAASGLPLKHKGSDSRSTLSSNGRVNIHRKRWQATGGGGLTPADALLDAAEATVSRGARELCCRLNATGKSFRRTADQLKHAAQLVVGQTLLREGVEYQAFWDQLLDWRAKQRGGKRQKADEVLNYVATRKQIIVYDECERHGWRISSSTTESQCGATPHRVKGQGKRWDTDNAEAVIAIEAPHQSDLWNQYWTTGAAQMN